MPRYIVVRGPVASPNGVADPDLPYHFQASRFVQRAAIATTFSLPTALCIPFEPRSKRVNDLFTCPSGTRFATPSFPSGQPWSLRNSNRLAAAAVAGASERLGDKARAQRGPRLLPSRLKSFNAGKRCSNSPTCRPPSVPETSSPQFTGEKLVVSNETETRPELRPTYSRKAKAWSLLVGTRGCSSLTLWLLERVETFF